MQDKPAVTAFPIQDALQKRWSPRAFDNKPLPKEEVISMFEAARWAMSGYNDQPWRFIVAQQGDDHYDKAFSCVGAWNQQWAQSAPLLGFIIADETSPTSGEHNYAASFEAGIAAGFLVIQAEHLGLRCHLFGGIHRDEIRKAFSVPEKHNIVCGFVCGHHGELKQIPESFHEEEAAPRTRKALSEIVFGSTWQEAYL